MVSIGRDYDNTLPPDYSVRIQGGHGIHGEPVQYLGEKEAREFLDRSRARSRE